MSTARKTEENNRIKSIHCLQSCLQTPEYAVYTVPVPKTWESLLFCNIFCSGLTRTLPTLLRNGCGENFETAASFRGEHSCSDESMTVMQNYYASMREKNWEEVNVLCFWRYRVPYVYICTCQVSKLNDER